MLELPIYWKELDVDYPLINLLVKKGYWSPRQAEQPQWICIERGSAFTRGWASKFDREIQSPFWLKWTEENPETAKEFWPAVLNLVRSGDSRGIRTAGYLLGQGHGISGGEGLMGLVAEYSE